MAYDHPTAMMRIYLDSAVFRARQALECLNYVNRHRSDDMKALARRQAAEWVRMAEEAQSKAIGWASR